MAIAGLIFGILGVTVFWWLGITLGGIWTTGNTVSTLLTGNVEVITWPIWMLGLGIGVALPLIGVGLSIAGLRHERSRGIALVGLVTSVVGALLGLVATFITASAVDVADTLRTGVPQEVAPADEAQMQKTLDDPDFQAKILEAMEAAKKKENAE